MKTHTVIGARMLEETPGQVDGPDGFLHMAHDICRWHHERWDGRGYPDGLKGEEIPIAAQVVALADVYDALTAVRVYKDPFPPEQALKMILNGECGAFNPVLLDCLVESADRLNRELELGDVEPMGNTEIRRVTSELMEHGELNASRRTLTLLEQSNARFDFYAEVTDELIFEYDRNSQRLKLSKEAAGQLGLKPLVLQPDADPAVQALGDSPLTIRALLDKTNADDPDAEGTYALKLPQGQGRFSIRMRTLWDGGNTAWTRVVGKLTKITK